MLRRSDCQRPPRLVLQLKGAPRLLLQLKYKVLFIVDLRGHVQASISQPPMSRVPIPSEALKNTLISDRVKGDFVINLVVPLSFSASWSLLL